MITLEEALTIRNVALDVEEPDAPAAVAKAVGLLKNDPQMLDWEAFSESVVEREKKNGTSVGGGLMLPHGRGGFVNELLMSFVRLRTPVMVEGEEVRYVIAVAVPSSMAADYLRLVGALARVFRDEKSTARLEEFVTSRDLLDWLSDRCR
ncbi:MAG TPA: PTS sugar transporter subunit IIA [Chthoniobacterales bacterium]|jgi:mannitol/fructose-specific phosphotransferase system IIA component (Ntr-type)